MLDLGILQRPMVTAVVIVEQSNMLINVRKQIAEAAVKRKSPSVYGGRNGMHVPNASLPTDRKPFDQECFAARLCTLALRQRFSAFCLASAGCCPGVWIPHRGPGRARNATLLVSSAGLCRDNEGCSFIALSFGMKSYGSNSVFGVCMPMPRAMSATKSLQL